MLENELEMEYLRYFVSRVDGCYFACSADLNFATLGRSETEAVRSLKACTYDYLFYRPGSGPMFHIADRRMPLLTRLKLSLRIPADRL